MLSDIKWPRRILPSLTDDSDVRLIAFTDASEVGIAACVYIWTQVGGQTQSHLLTSKAKIVSAKAARTIVQLELNAAVMGTRLLLSSVEELISLKFTNLHLFSDSTIVLCFLKSQKKLPKYVSCRVAEIQRAGLHLHHIPGPQNPADWPSRGTPTAYINSPLWRHGPPLLLNTGPEEWEEFEPSKVMSQEYEATLAVMDAAKPVQATLPEMEETPAEIKAERHSSLRSLIFITAIVLRFASRNLRIEHGIVTNGKLHFPNSPSALERKQALHLWLLAEQKACYLPELLALQSNKTTQLCKQLDLMLSEDGLIRCGGRLDNACLTLGAKHPILLKKNRHISQLIVLEAHAKVFHKKATYTLNEVRRTYWIPHGISFVSSVIRKTCNLCRLIGGPTYKTPPMGPLPKERLSCSRAFEVVGIDYAGPVNVKVDGEKKHIWILLITCFATRAVHLETTASTSAEDTILALRRFFARRCRSRIIYSDNATGFVKAAHLLKSNQQSVPDFLASELVEFRLNPPASPWVGGVFKRLIGVCKSMLRATFWKRVVELKVLQTVLVEVEGVMNTRPLCQTRPNLGDGSVLTPADFIAPNGMLGTSLLVEDKTDPDYMPKSDVKTVSRPSQIKQGQEAREINGLVCLPSPR